jgi:hypothetical protein
MSPDSSYFLPIKSSTWQDNTKDHHSKIVTPDTPIQQFTTSQSEQTKLFPVISRITHFDKEYQLLRSHIEAEKEDLLQRRDFETKKATT